MEDTLAELEVDQLPMVIALNKTDLIEHAESVVENLELAAPSALVSARTGKGLDQLLMLIEATLVGALLPVEVLIPYGRGDLISLFYQRGQVDQERHTQEGVHLFGRVPERLLSVLDPFRPA